MNISPKQKCFSWLLKLDESCWAWVQAEGIKIDGRFVKFSNVSNNDCETNRRMSMSVPLTPSSPKWAKLRGLHVTFNWRGCGADFRSESEVRLHLEIRAQTFLKIWQNNSQKLRYKHMESLYNVYIPRKSHIFHTLNKFAKFQSISSPLISSNFKREIKPVPQEKHYYRFRVLEAAPPSPIIMRCVDFYYTKTVNHTQPNLVLEKYWLSS